MSKHQKEELERELAEADALTRKAEAFLAKNKVQKQNKPKVWAIVLLMTAIWGLYAFDHYTKHHLPRWFVFALCVITALAYSWFLVYCFLKGKVYTGFGSFYRSEEAFLYWAYMVFYLFWDIVIIYVLVRLLAKGTI